MSNARSLRIELSPSRALTAALLAVHGVGGAAAAATLPAPWGGALAAALCALGMAAAWDRALLRGARALRALELLGPDDALVELRDGTRCALRPGVRRSVNKLWLALPVRLPGRRSVLICADMLEPQEFRVLRLWALCGRVASPASGVLRPGA